MAATSTLWINFVSTYSTIAESLVGVDEEIFTLARAEPGMYAFICVMSRSLAQLAPKYFYYFSLGSFVASDITVGRLTYLAILGESSRISNHFMTQR